MRVVVEVGSEVVIRSRRKSLREAIISSAQPIRAERGLRISCLEMVLVASWI